MTTFLLLDDIQHTMLIDKHTSVLVCVNAVAMFGSGHNESVDIIATFFYLTFAIVRLFLH